MHIIQNVIWGAGEFEIVRDTLKCQIDSLNAIIQNEVEGEDVIMHCIREEVDRMDLIEETTRFMEYFINMHKNPIQVFDMDSHTKSTFIHTIYALFPEKTIPRDSVLRKLELSEMIVKSLN